MPKKWGLKFFLGLAIASVGVMFYVVAPAPPAREPASIPATVGASFPVNLVCAGGATADRIFQFSSVPGELVVNYDSAGKARVTGVAEILVRLSGDTSDFEGPVSWKGTRSPDGLRYDLEGSRAGQHFLLELNKNGESQMTRILTGPLGSPEKSYFSANCSEAR